MEVQVRKGFRQFRDPLKFPRGFSRTGDFSIADARILSDYGETLLALEEGRLIAENDEEVSFVKVALGLSIPATKLEKAWCKYTKLARNRREFFSLNGARKSTNDDYSESTFDYDSLESEIA